MKIGDIIGLMGQIAPVIREYTENALKPALARVEAVEETVKGFKVPRDGKDVDPASVERLVAEKVAAIPVPKDGADGLGFDDIEVIHDGARGFTLKFSQGDRVKVFPFSLPVVLDKGVYKADEEYEPGDGVTYGGSFWIAQEKTAEKPDGGNGWRLAVKRGRAGKDAVAAPAGTKEPVRVGVPSEAV